jgi:hypothetical protein
MKTPDSTPWRAGWRHVAPRLPTTGLRALADTLRAPDSDLCRSVTVLGPTVDCAIPDAAPVQACAVAYALWKAQLLEWCDSVERAFDVFLGAMPDAHLEDVSTFLRWFDDQRRAAAEVFADLLPEVLAELDRRAAGRGQEAPETSGSAVWDNATTVPETVPLLQREGDENVGA